MLLDQATPEQMRAGQALTGLAMVGLFGSRIFGRHGHRVRIGISIAYVAGVLAFIVYSLF